MKKSYDYETLDGKRRLSEDNPSKTFIALHTFLFLFALSAISRSFVHHARKDAATNLPPIEKVSYTDVTASFSEECPANSSLASLTWNFSSSATPDFPFYEISAGDLTILGPKSLLVDEFTKAMESIYRQQRNVARERRHAAHHLDKLFYWKKTLSVFSGSLLVPFDEAVSELSAEHPDAFFRASSERIEFHFEPKSEIVIFILRDGRLWLAALAVNSKLGLQALTQTILHAAEFGMKEDGAEPGRFYILSKDSKNCFCADATLSQTISQYLQSNSVLPAKCSSCESLSRPYVQLIMPSSSGFRLGRDPNIIPLILHHDCSI